MVHVIYLPGTEDTCNIYNNYYDNYKWCIYAFSKKL